MELKRKFNVIFAKEAREFILSLPLSARKRIAYNIDKVSFGEIDNTLFKKLENTDIWEFRTLYNSKAYRLLSFWDTENDTFVVATNGFIKKTQKTPKKEIAKAEEIRKRYFNKKQR